jgi:hypothetical protein
VERIPGEPLERRAGEGLQPRQRRADRVHPRLRPCERPDADRRGHFTQWVDAYAQDQTELADFYFKRFRAEFKPAVDAWIATRPLRNPDAPLTPFAMPEYEVAATEEANQLEAEAEAFAAEARTNVQRATNYVLGVVLFAAALFFAGMSARLRTRRLRVVLLSFGIAVFVGTVVWLATFPVSISV